MHVGQTFNTSHSISSCCIFRFPRENTLMPSVTAAKSLGCKWVFYIFWTSCQMSLMVKARPVRK
uniref:Uncharacterized protein n=1 Tax=Anguilla anguilla TaxID=7936 RepID=A0A0E9XVZ6_ANGAN